MANLVKELAAELEAAGLSYLGLGARPPMPEWGAMLNDARDYWVAAPWALIFPGVAITTLVLGFNLLGDGLREALIVSALHLEVDASMAAGSEPRVVLSPAEGDKCARCWKTLPLGTDPLHPTLCAPCSAIVREFDANAA